MLKAEIKARGEYGFHGKLIPGAPLEHVRILEHIRGNEGKVEWIYPNPGLVHYPESGQLASTMRYLRPASSKEVQDKLNAVEW